MTEKENIASWSKAVQSKGPRAVEPMSYVSSLCSSRTRCRVSVQSILVIDPRERLGRG